MFTEKYKHSANERFPERQKWIKEQLTTEAHTAPQVFGMDIKGGAAWSLPLSPKRDMFVSPMWIQNAICACTDLHKLLFPT